MDVRSLQHFMEDFGSESEIRSILKVLEASSSYLKIRVVDEERRGERERERDS